MCVELQIANTLRIAKEPSTGSTAAIPRAARGGSVAVKSAWPEAKQWLDPSGAGARGGPAPLEAVTRRWGHALG
jgi:hypothetical protein